MRVAGRVAEVVFAVVLVQPGGLEEATSVVVRGDGRLGLRVEDDDVGDGRGQRDHVVGELRDFGVQRAARRGLVGAELRLVEGALGVALQLAAPQPAKVQVRLAVVVDEDGRVHAVRARDGLRLRLEGPLGLVAHRHADPEHVLLVPRGEVQVVFAVLGRGVRRP